MTGEIRLEDIPEGSRGGDCYEAAVNYVMNRRFQNPDEDLILVHGEVTGQASISGIKYGHAWVERGDMVIEVSSGRDWEIPKPVYYAVGNIDESKVFRYDYAHMQSKIMETHIYGPWDLVTDF